MNQADRSRTRLTLDDGSYVIVPRPIEFVRELLKRNAGGMFGMPKIGYIECARVKKVEHLN